MNPTEIFDALEAIAKAGFDPEEFGFQFAEATDNAAATISRLRGGSLNRSDISGGVLLNRKFHYAPALERSVAAVLDALRTSKKTEKHKPAILLSTDGKTVAAEHVKSGEQLHCAFSEIGDHFGFFLPAAGKDRYRPAEENPVDVKATGKLAKLYDALIKANPDWDSEARKHDMNQFMTRLIFCLFAEDVEIFPKDQFSRLIFTHSGNRGEEAHRMLISAFTAMNRRKDDRDDLPAWCRELEYVNGGLFSGVIDAPTFNVIAFRYLHEASRLFWRDINPDIFGSMIQSVADQQSRAELGMHYTSVPNIIKVLGPLFLDELDDELEKAWDRPNRLRKLLNRMSSIRVFDPACGSGNFLVVAYRELRAREIRILRRLNEIKGENQIVLWSQIPITNFYGIELSDFAAETAKLAMFIAEYQANSKFSAAFGRAPAALPLKGGANIRNGNALQMSWAEVCPPSSEAEVFIVGNPPFLGTTYRAKEQRRDMARVFNGRVSSHGRLDLSAAWMLLASEYVKNHDAESALITTSSTVQGASVEPLWSVILREGVAIKFAHRPFKWRNNAKRNAAVEVVVVGLTTKSGERRLFSARDVAAVENINAYLIAGPNIFVKSTRHSLFGLPKMAPGNFPYDFGHLILDSAERDALLTATPEAERFIRRFAGSKETIHDLDRFCLWIDDEDLAEAYAIPFIAERIDRVRRDRQASTDTGTQKLASRPHQFREHIAPQSHSILMPRTSSERRPYLPAKLERADLVSSDNNHVILDGEEWLIAILASRLHLVWITTVSGKLESRIRYSNTLGWNTFPTPSFTATQIEELGRSARMILKTRYKHHPATLGELYDPEQMPDDLRAVHQENDELLESMYIGRPFKADTERLERLFKLYTGRVEKLKKEAA